jgi:hypothetical protein
MYEKPNQYLNKICDLLSIDSEELKEHWPTYIEAKARRDLGVHNSWLCNSVYMRKISEAGLDNKYKEGEELFPSDREYCKNVVLSIFTISNIIMRLVLEK